MDRFKHDLGNQLTVFKLTTSLLEKLLRNKDVIGDEEIRQLRKYLETIENALEEANELVDEYEDKID